MPQTSYALLAEQKKTTSTMKALVFYGPGQIGLETVPVPKARAGEAVIRVTLTTICGTDLHILRGEYPVKPGLIIGHEPVGIIHELGEGITGYEVGDRVLVGAITPCGQCNFCLGGNWSQCGGPLGGWKFGNTINGAQAEYLLVPHAQANLARIPDELADEQVVFLGDIASTGISAAESADLEIGDTVAVFAQGPIGLCATAGAKLLGRESDYRGRVRPGSHRGVKAYGCGRCARLYQRRCGREYQASHSRTGRRCRYRGSGDSSYV